MIALSAQRPGASCERPDSNPQYARISNPLPFSARVIKLKLARKWVEQGRAIWIEGLVLSLVREHPSNIEAAERAGAAKSITDAGYDGVRAFTDWEPGRSDNCTVLMARRLS